MKCLVFGKKYAHKMATVIVFRQTGKKLVACQFRGDSEWYRARVTDFSTRDLTVHYVDYGNVDTVPFGFVQSLESKHALLPFQVLRKRCKISYKCGQIKDLRGIYSAQNVKN